MNTYTGKEQSIAAAGLPKTLHTAGGSMEKPRPVLLYWYKKLYPYPGHILFWCIYILYLYTVNKTLVSNNTLFVDILAANVISIWVFYSSFYFWQTALTNNNWPKALLVFVCSAAIFYAARYAYVYLLLPLLGKTPYTTFNSQAYVRGNILLFTQFFIFGIGYYFSVRSAKKEKQLLKMTEEKQHIEHERLQLEQHNAQLEKQQLQTEYAFLRSQINPHFLQNTLNFFYSKSLTCSEELSSAILTLSEIMRYSLNTKTNEAPPLLTEEIKQMNNVIAINQMRFGNRLQIAFTQTGDAEGIRIIPLVLITLVENAFKHGELGNAEHPMKISLDISEYQESLVFTVSNLKKTGPKDNSHGIGLENIRRRLQLVYNGEASLESVESTTAYSITLNIKKLHP